MHRSDPSEAVLVLAAGRGSRMGGPKALMVVDGHPWWRRQQDRLSRWNARALWVVSPEVAAIFANAPDAPPTIPADPDAPMFASIAAGLGSLAAHPPDAVTILPVDVPACAPATFAALCDRADVPSAPSHSGRRGHPIRLPWRFIRKAILPHLTDPTWVAHARLDTLAHDAIVDVPVDDPAVTINLNTPDDVDRWLRSDSPRTGP